MGSVQYREGNHDKCGGYLEYREGCSVLWGDILSTVGVFSTMGDIMSTVGVILSTVGAFSTVGEIMMHVGGCSVPLGEIFCYLSTPQY